MYGNHRYTPDSKELGAVKKDKAFSTDNNPYQTPPSEITGSTHPQVSTIKRKTNLAIIISDFLSDISRRLSNSKINNSSQNILKFLNEVFKRSKCSKENAILATFYFQKIYQFHTSSEASLPEFSHCSKRIFLCCLILSHKFLNDNTYSMKNWQIISGLHAKDLSLMERWCLGRLNYELAVPYSDLLLWETNTLMKKRPHTAGLTNAPEKRPRDPDHDCDLHSRKLLKSC
ncbi:pcl5p [Saccharomyces arboricola H-6]|uniref:Pcl5p n=1 Tax=Saccharomyces arboricola (strain H-6 / AS 2.3317 / CBS 10644) TaxID=1160507 RepID=J8LMV6_SACAR|nr:pcl5p [Saccharomyces arboricola H-6]